MIYGRHHDVRLFRVDERAMKKTLVTAASTGIGRAIAELLVAQGYEVWGKSRATSMTPCSSRWTSPISTCGKIKRKLRKRTVVFLADSARKNSLSFSKINSLRTANALSPLDSPTRATALSKP